MNFEQKKLTILLQDALLRGQDVNYQFFIFFIDLFECNMKGNE
jgi:hypothetical protein